MNTQTLRSCALIFLGICGMLTAAPPVEPAQGTPLWRQAPNVGTRILGTDTRIQITPAGAAPTEIKLTEFETAYVSPAGNHCVVYDRNSKQAKSFDADATQRATFRTFDPCAVLLVSNSGNTVAFESIRNHPGLTDEISFIDAAGHESWTEENFSRKNEVLRFSPDGQLLAILAIEQQADKSGKLVLALFDTSGRRYSIDLPEGMEPGDVAFGNNGTRIVAGLNQTLPNGTESSSLVVWDPQAGSINKFATTDLGQIITYDSLAFDRSDDSILVNGMAKVQKYNAATGQKVWTTELNSLDRKKDLLDTAAKLSVTQDRIIVAHRVSAPAGLIKYAICILNMDGKLLESKIPGPPQPRSGTAGRFWDIAADGRSIAVYLKPDPIKVSIP